jgi:hypothetical protein
MNQQEQIAQGSLRSSHRNTHAVVFKKTPLKDQTRVLEFLSSMCKDLVISQRINSSNTIGSYNRQNSVASNGSIASYAEVPLKKGTFFVHSSLSKAEPGFLILIPKSNPVFVKYNLSKREREINKGQPICYTLRMRVSPEIYEGSIFIASLDGINHSLCLEDIYVWKTQNIFENSTFTERRKYMKEFVERHWIPDVRLLGGIITEVMNPKPLSALSELQSVQDFTKVFLIPDSPGKRRFTFNLNESVAHIQNGYYGRKDTERKGFSDKLSEKQLPEKQLPEKQLSEKQLPEKQISEKQLPEKHVHPTRAKAIKIPLLPDIYELYALSGKPLNKAAVQQLELSKILKEHGDEIQVNIQYNKDFKRYEIIGLTTP